jgi:integrase
MRGVYEITGKGGQVVYAINYLDENGKRHRERVGPDCNLAEQAYLQKRQEVHEGKFIAPRAKSLAMKELLERHEANAKGRLSARAHQENIYRKNILLNDYGLDKLTADKVTPSVVLDVLQQIVTSGVSRATANRYRTYLSTVFAYGKLTGRVRKNPVAEVAKYKEPDGRIRFLSDEEEADLRKSIRELHPSREAEFDLALNTGMRRGEQFRLTWDYVNLKRNVITVHGKTGRRHIPLNSAALVALTQLRNRNVGGVAPVTAAHGPRPATDANHVNPEYRYGDGQKDWRRWFEACIDDACIENFRWHDLRHTFASRLVMAGVDLPTVQRLMGHKTIAMTMRYAHLADGHVTAAVERLVKSPAASGFQVVQGGKAGAR